MIKKLAALGEESELENENENRLEDETEEGLTESNESESELEFLSEREAMEGECKVLQNL